jgi:hypothetical protein
MTKQTAALQLSPNITRMYYESASVYMLLLKMNESFGFQDQLKAHAYLDWDRSWDKTNNKLGCFFLYLCLYICWYSYSLFNFVLPYHWRLLKNSFKQVWKQNQSNIISFKKAMFDIDKINSINILLNPKTPFVIPQRYTKKPQYLKDYNPRLLDIQIKSNNCMS